MQDSAHTDGVVTVNKQELPGQFQHSGGGQATPMLATFHGNAGPVWAACLSMVRTLRY
jgi:hypothetical protein